MMGLLTVYVAVGSWFKDRRLIFYLGDAYRGYQERVPGYPLVGFGPLGRVRPNEASRERQPPDSSPSPRQDEESRGLTPPSLAGSPSSHPHVTSPGSNGLARSALRGSTRTA